MKFCDICESAESETETHVGSLTNYVQCIVCDETFNIQAFLEEHTERNHTNILTYNNQSFSTEC